MSDQSAEAPEPQGTDDAGTAQLGEPERQGSEVPHGDVDVDLEARQERLSEHRKPAGPPLRDEGQESPEQDPPAVEETNPSDPT